MRAPWVPIAFLGWWWAAACAPPERTPAVLRLEAFHQAGAQGVFLNETLQMRFSAELDRASVTRQSLRILDPRGSPVRGRIEVKGRSVEFHPELPREPDLSDGGFVPGETYRVELLGFPFPDGLRGPQGEPMPESLRFHFSTLARSDDQGERVFVAPLQEVVPLLSLDATRIGPLDPILLRCDAPLDPRSIDAGSFELFDDAGPHPLRVRLVENHAGGAVIELRMLGESRTALAAFEPGSWFFLRIPYGQDPPTTLGGIPVQPRWQLARPGFVRIEVYSSALALWRVAFDEGSEDLRSNEAVAGFDGTATWADGSVTVRYPRAAGSGVHGAVELGPEEWRSDLHASRLGLAQGSQCTLRAEGLVVLRSQGALEIAGSLRRLAPAATPRPMTFAAGETLSGWLEAARAEDPAWTVLVAGGDLVVPGSLEIEGPLLLVAGGRIRISGPARAREIWKLSPGGGPNVKPEPRWVPAAIEPSLAPAARFTVDEPVENPLVEPLRLAVLSGAFRPRGGVAVWRAGRYGGDPGAGDLRVRWLGQRAGESGIEEFGPVDDPLLLSDSDSLRFQVELFLPADGGVWNPPRVDYVEFRWDAPAPGAAR